MKVEWLPAAIGQRSAQLDHVAVVNPRAAAELWLAIKHHTNMLADHPDMGRVGRVKGTRELAIARTQFVAIYRVRRQLQRVEIVRFLHGRQQWPAL